MTGNTRASKKAHDHFEKYASAGCIGFGIISGALYASAIYSPVSNFEARIVLTSLFVSAGIMGLAYFADASIGRRCVPFLVEILRVFFFLWFVIGVIFGLLTLLGLYVPPNYSVPDAAVSFLVGAIAGIIWLMSLILFIGIRAQVAGWTVISFPYWILVFLRWVWRSVWRR